MRQAKPVQHVGDGRERLHRDPAGRKRRLDLTKRDPGLARHDGPQVVRMRLQQRTPVAADLGWRRAAGLAHPLHQLNGRRRADREATGRLPDRTTTFDGPHEPLTEVLGQGSGHNEPGYSRPQLPGIRTSDSVQLQTALDQAVEAVGVEPDAQPALALQPAGERGSLPSNHQGSRPACPGRRPWWHDLMAAPQTAPKTDPMNCSKLALRVPPRLLWVATTAAITAQKLWERPRVAPSAKVTAAAAVMRRVSQSLVRWRRSQEGPKPALVTSGRCIGSTLNEVSEPDWMPAANTLCPAIRMRTLKVEPAASELLKAGPVRRRTYRDSDLMSADFCDAPGPCGTSCRSGFADRRSFATRHRTVFGPESTSRAGLPVSNPGGCGARPKGWTATETHAGAEDGNPGGPRLRPEECGGARPALSGAPGYNQPLGRPGASHLGRESCGIRGPSAGDPYQGSM